MKPTGKAMLTILISFVLGAVVGYAAFRVILLPEAPKPAPSGISRLRSELHDRLSLNTAQQTRLDSLLQRRRVVFENFRKQMSGHYQEMRETTRDSIRQILTEEQKPQFELFVRELDQRREKEKGSSQ